MARPMTAVRAVGYTSSESEWSYLFENWKVPENNYTHLMEVNADTPKGWEVKIKGQNIANCFALLTGSLVTITPCISWLPLPSFYLFFLEHQVLQSCVGVMIIF